MKDQRRLVFAFAACGVAFWVLDALLDTLFFYEGTFIELLVTQVPPHEIYIRLVAMIVFVAFGLIVAGLNRRRQRSESELARFGRLFEDSLNEIFLFDPDTLCYTQVNAAGQQNLGYTLDELRSMTPLDVKPHFTPESFAEMIAPLRLGEVAKIVFETVHQRKDGSQYDIEVHLQMLAYEQEDTFAAIILDITDRRRAERTLRETEALQRTAFNALDEAMHVVDSDLRILHHNRSFGELCKEFGGPEIAVGMFLGDVCPFLTASALDEYRRAFQTGESSRTQETFRHGDRLMATDVQRVPLYIGAEITGVITSVADTTERYLAEEALLLTQLAVDSSRDAIYWMEADAKFIYVNDAATEALGYTREELLTMTVHDIGPEYPKEVWPAHWAKLVEERSFLKQTIHQRKDGTVFPVEISLNLVEFGDRQINCAIVRDVTERRRAEAERERLLTQIRDQAQQLADVMSSVPEGLLVLDAACRVVLANPIATRDLGELAGVAVGDVLLHIGDRPINELLTSPEGNGLWHEVRSGCRHFELMSRPLSYGSAPESWVVVYRDVTQERVRESALVRQERLAAVGQLAAGIAHDFNNILAVILLYAQLGLRNPQTPSKLRRELGVIEEQAHRAAALVQQILDFGREAVLVREPLDLRAFLDKLMQLLRRTVPESIVLTYDCGDGDFVANADPSRIQQAIINLVVNARDAMMPAGGPLRIVLSRVYLPAGASCSTCGLPIEGDWLRVDVVDAGCGIPPDVLLHLFEPFYTTKEVGKGSGLGLPQVYGIMSQHDGHVAVTTEVGYGATFSLFLPPVDGEAPLDRSGAPDVAIYGEGETVLVVEDNATLRAALRESLEMLGYATQTAGNGRQALAYLTDGKSKFDLVLTDLVMPEMGGHALISAIRERGWDLPVVVMSGHPLLDELPALQAQGLAGWLHKPPGMLELSCLLARILRPDST